MTDYDILVEKDAIRELKARYFRFLDAKDWENWRKVFADDFEIIADLGPARPGEEARRAPLPAEPGADAIVAHLSKQLADYVTVHHGHMPEITITGPDTATGIWAMEDIVEMPGGAGVMRGYGHYHERYRKVDGEWKIAKSHLTRLRLDFAPGAAQADRA